MVGMVLAFSGTGFQRIAPGHDAPCCASQGKENRFVHVGRMDIGRKWFSIDKNIHSSRSVVLYDADALLLIGGGGAVNEKRDTNYSSQQACCDPNFELMHIPSLPISSSGSWVSALVVSHDSYFIVTGKNS